MKCLYSQESDYFNKQYPVPSIFVNKVFDDDTILLKYGFIKLCNKSSENPINLIIFFNLKENSSTCSLLLITQPISGLILILLVLIKRFNKGSPW